MTNPFSNQVGLKGVTDGDRPVWVNDLPGLSTELVEAVAEQEDTTIDDPAGSVGVWSRVGRLALDKLLSLVEGELSKSADFRYTVAQTGLPAFGGEQIIQPSTSYIGVLITAPYAPYHEVYLDYLSLSSATDVTDVLLVVVDLNTGGILHDQQVDIEQGYNGIDLRQIIPMRMGQSAKLFAGVRADDLTLTAFGMQQWKTTDPRYTLLPQYYPIGHGKLTYGNPFAGVGIQASVRNSIGSVVARYADRLQWAYAYLCGSLLMTEKLASPRINLFTNTNRLYTEEQETKLLDEAKNRIRPVSRDMLKELAQAEVVSKRDAPFDPGYTMGSFV